MYDNPIKHALLKRKITFGTWMQLGEPGISEILANAGFDWICIDCEHTDIDITSFGNLTRGMFGRGAMPFARVRENSTMAIRQVLDIGAYGVIVPLVNNAKEARDAVRAAKYPPDGIRGFAFSRINDWGVDAKDYFKKSNSNTAVIVMIETREAVENVEEIISTDGVDGVFIGPYDLSGSYGVIGDIDNIFIVKAFEKVVEASVKYNKSAGIHLVNPEEKSIQDTIKKGFTFISLGMDTVFLDQAARKSLAYAKAITGNPQKIL